jgi:hypothetical protein
MSRNISPVLAAEYRTKLINKGLLQQKFHEMLDNALIKEPNKNDQ